MYHDHELQSLHGVYPGAQRDIIANSLQASELTPVISLKGPPFAPVGYQRAACGAMKRTVGTSPKRRVPRVKLDTNARTGAGPLRERRWDLDDNPQRRRCSKNSSAKDAVFPARCKEMDCVSRNVHRSGEYDIAES